jgi:hypothetical protein
MRKRLPRALKKLSKDIQHALEVEQRLLARLDSSARADVWAAMRNNDSSFLASSRPDEQDSSLSRRKDDTFADVYTDKKVLKRVEPYDMLPCPRSSDGVSEYEEKECDGISFGEFSSMDTNSKRARIRVGLQRQQANIRSLLERIQRREAAYHHGLLAAETDGSI